MTSLEISNGTRATKTPSDVNKAKMPPADVCLELLGFYFDYIHDQFHSIFHRPSLEEDVRMGKAPPLILYAIMALSARLVALPSHMPSLCRLARIQGSHCVLRSTMIAVSKSETEIVSGSLPTNFLSALILKRGANHTPMRAGNILISTVSL